MIRLSAIGNLGNDAEVKQIEKAVIISFSVAVQEGYGDKKKTVWLNCSKFEKPDSDAKIAQYLTKGTKVYVDGSPSVRAYDGGASLDLKVNNVELLG